MVRTGIKTAETASNRVVTFSRQVRSGFSVTLMRINADEVSGWHTKKDVTNGRHARKLNG